jgi:UrcA family protein
MSTSHALRASLHAITCCILLIGASAARADAVTEWNAITESTILVATADPAARARTAVIVQVAVFEAVNSIIGDYEPYRSKLHAPSGASPEAAAIAAAHRALVSLHPGQTQQLDASRDRSLAAIADGAAKRDGIAVGIAAADTILALRAHDGFDTPVSYTPGTQPGQYRPTPPENLPAYRPGLGQVATFSIRDARQFRSPPPPSLRSKKYARDYEEVKQGGEAHSKERPEDRLQVARFYDATDGEQIYYPAARQVLTARPQSLSKNARLFALLAIAMWDSAIACFETKYHFNLWRPVTAIREGATDGNDRTAPDANWQAAVFTPPFPAYPSGHATFGGAARVVLEREFGRHGHSITLTNPALPEIVLSYTTFRQITDDIDDGRVFGGVHYRFDQEAGARMGERVGEYVLRHTLRPVRHHQPTGRPSRVVDFADLDITDPAQAGVLYERIETAAVQVCGSVRAHDVAQLWVRPCVQHAIERAVSDVNNARAHAGRGGRSLTTNELRRSTSRR